MAGLGYEIDGDNIYVRFGDYTDIHDSHTPDPECPMPENERLANYTMRLLAMLDLSGWRLVQAVPEDQKNPGIHALRNGVSNKILDTSSWPDLTDPIYAASTEIASINLNLVEQIAAATVQLTAINAAVEELEGELITMEATLAGMLLAYGLHAAVEETNWGLLLTGEAAIVTSLAAMNASLALMAISGEGWSPDNVALAIEYLTKIQSTLDAGLIKDEKPLLDEIDQTLQAEDAAEQILNLQGETSVYFKSRTVRD
jgi:hypothetical protein